MKKSYNLNMLAALPCEAQVLVECFQLTKIVRRPTPFPIFTNKFQNIHLVISGVGRVNMAAAVAYLHLFTHEAPFNSFLNIGIAGSNEFKIGQAVLINKIISLSSDRQWYPFVSPIKYPYQGTLCTYDQPQTIIPCEGLVDMEGSAFFQAASCFVTQEQIQLLKIISDHDLQSQKAITPLKVVTLMRENLQAIRSIADYLMGLSQQEASIDVEDDNLEHFKKKWHFTYAQELELKIHLKRWQNLQLGSAWDVCKNEKGASQVLRVLNAKSNLHRIMPITSSTHANNIH